MHLFVSLLAQISDDKLNANGGAPIVGGDYSYLWQWVVVAVADTGILLVTFKTSKRNHMERE